MLPFCKCNMLKGYISGSPINSQVSSINGSFRQVLIYFTYLYYIKEVRLTVSFSSP